MRKFSRVRKCITFSKPHVSHLVSSIYLLSVMSLACQAVPVYPELIEGKPLVVASLLFQTIMIVFVFHFFLLKEKSGAKKFKAALIAPRRQPGQRTASLRFFP
jgi:hypothetical protein